jgi:hypothetical protein
MKLSELKKQIKDNIYEILSEESVTENFGPAVQSTDPKAREIEDKINKDPEFLKKTKEAMAKAEKGDNTDLAILMGGFGKMSESDDEDREPTKDELEKEKVKGAHAKKTISDEKFEDFKTKLKNIVKKIKDMKKGKERDAKMTALKQFIKKPELVKAFKERDVKIDTGDLIG